MAPATGGLDSVGLQLPIRAPMRVLTSDTSRMRSGSSARPRYALLKGVCGWGDRLQCLLQAIRYCKVTNRTLVIDWRDPDWTHDPSTPLTRWFTIDGVRTLSIAEFTKVWGEILSDYRVLPSSWFAVLTQPSYSDFIYEAGYGLPGGEGALSEILRGGRWDFDEEVVVLPGIGYRSFRYNDLAMITLSREVSSRIKAFANDYGLATNSYDVVHLRGGSKRWAGGDVPLVDLNERIHARWPTSESYVRDLYQSYSRQGSPRRLLLMSDRPQLIAEWQDRYGCGEAVPSTAGELLRESGTHRLTAEDLKRESIAKDDLTYEVLRDFVLMLNAGVVISDGISLFSKMARKCGALGVKLLSFSS